MKGSDSGKTKKRNPQISWKYTYFYPAPLYQGPPGNHEFCKMFYFRAFVRSFPINNNCVRLFWSENHKVKLRWLFDKNPLCCFTTNYYSRPALEMPIPKGLVVGFSKSGSAKKSFGRIMKFQVQFWHPSNLRLWRTGYVIYVKIV